VSFAVTGPGVIVGDQPFALEESGGSVGQDETLGLGNVTVKATHSTPGSRSIEI
jgi:hypothetical protein